MRHKKTGIVWEYDLSKPCKVVVLYTGSGLIAVCDDPSFTVEGTDIVAMKKAVDDAMASHGHITWEHYLRVEIEVEEDEEKSMSLRSRLHKDLFSLTSGFRISLSAGFIGIRPNNEKVWASGELSGDTWTPGPRSYPLPRSRENVLLIPYTDAAVEAIAELKTRSDRHADVIKQFMTGPDAIERVLSKHGFEGVPRDATS